MSNLPPPRGRRYSTPDPRYVRAYRVLDARFATFTPAHLAAGGCPTCAARPDAPCVGFTAVGLPKTYSRYRHPARVPSV